MNSFRQRKRPSVGSTEQEPSAEKDDPNMSKTLNKGDSKSTLPIDADESTEVSDAMNDQAQELMKDNLEMMHEIVMRIREDEEFASNIYANCPRLQHLLDEHPDLRPVFEDPILVRINFEQVYRDAGGVLPEDKPKKRSWLAVIVNHPLFKVLKVLLMVKKIVNCVMGGGFAMIKGCFMGLCVDEAAEMLGEGGVDGDGGGAEDLAEGEGGNPANQACKEQLNQAAEHMEDPEVQEKMADVLETNDPDQLADMIENDAELKALRDSNALCAELMSDPESMRVLVDPENLRALGEAPDMIEADFADPNWTPDDLEAGGTEQALDTVPEADVEADADAEAEEGEEGFDEENPESEMDLEEEEEGEGPEYELGDADNNARGGGGKKGNKKGGQNRGGGFMAQVGAGLTDMVASELVGFGAGDIMGGDDGLGALEEAEAAADAADGAEAAATGAEDTAMAAAEAAEFITSDGMDGLEDGLDELEDGADEGDPDAEEESNRNAERARAAGIGAAAGLGAYGAGQAVGAARKKKGDGKEEGDEEGLKNVDDDATAASDDEEEVEKKKSRFGFVGSFASTMATAAKEHVTTTLLGDDFGEALVEKQEERAEKRAEEKAAKKKAKEEAKKAKEEAKAAAGEDGEQSEKGRRRMFGKKR